jgi:hypothetical protein
MALLARCDMSDYVWLSTINMSAARDDSISQLSSPLPEPARFHYSTINGTLPPPHPSISKLDKTPIRVGTLSFVSAVALSCLVSQGYEIPLSFAHMGSYNFSITKTMTTLRASGFRQFLLQYQKSHGACS